MSQPTFEQDWQDTLAYCPVCQAYRSADEVVCEASEMPLREYRKITDHRHEMEADTGQYEEGLVTDDFLVFVWAVYACRRCNPDEVTQAQGEEEGDEQEEYL